MRRHITKLSFLAGIVLLTNVILSVGCLSQGLLDSNASPFSGGPALHPPLLLDPLVVTGTVGEFRNGNFHYGLDFSTGGDTGVPIYAIDDGHVRRIMFGRYNIGYAIRIEHADGRVSRYGHLSAFSNRLLAHPRVAKIHDRILLRRDFALHISDNSLPVRRGEIIGSSGETGIGFAHLHFEYLDGDGRTFLNPLRFGLRIPDRRPPILRTLHVAPAGFDSRPNESNQGARVIALRPAGPPIWNPAAGPGRFEQEYIPARALRTGALEAPGRLEFQLDAYDPAEPQGRSRLGLAAGRLYFSDRPDETLFAFRFDRLRRVPGYRHGMLFDRFRTKLRGGARYLYNYYDRAPGSLPFVFSNETRGRVNPKAQAPETPGSEGARTTVAGRTIVLSAQDAAGNLSRVSLPLRDGSGGATGHRKSSREAATAIAASTANVFVNRASEIKSPDGRLRLRFEAGQTFENLALRVRAAGRPKRLPKGMQALSPAFVFERVTALPATRRNQTAARRHAAYIDFLSPIRGDIAGPAPANFRAHPRQIGIYRLGSRGVYPLSLPEAEQSLFADGRYHFRTRSTGLIAVLADRAPPEFRPVARHAPGKVHKRAARDRRFRGDVYRRPEMRLFLRPEDRGSGVDFSSLQVSVDGVDCYTDHDPDRKHAEVFWPAHIARPGDHQLIATVRDRAGNRSKSFRYAYRVIE